MSVPERSSTFLSEQLLDGWNVAVLGCGAVGGQAAMTLARMGVPLGRFLLIDRDEVGPENIGPQVFPADYIGKNKAEALAGCLAEQCEHSFAASWFRADLSKQSAWNLIDLHLEHGNWFVVLAVDSMELRGEIVSRLAVAERHWIIDTRMGLQQLWCTVLPPGERQRAYAASLYSDAAAVQEPCTERAIAFTPMLSAAIIGRVFTAVVRNELPLPSEIHADLRTFTMWGIWPDGIVSLGGAA